MRAAGPRTGRAREWREAHRSHVTAAVRASSSKRPRLLKDVRETIEEEKHGRTSIVDTQTSWFTYPFCYKCPSSMTAIAASA